MTQPVIVRLIAPALVACAGAGDVVTASVPGDSPLVKAVMGTWSGAQGLAKCPGGNLVFSGGCACGGEGSSLVWSTPDFSANAWSCGCADNGEADVTAYAFCADL